MNSKKEVFNGPERRKFPRFKLTNVLVCGLILLEKVEGRILDISACGICVATPEAMTEDSLFLSYIVLPGESRKIMIKGRVVWCQRAASLPDFMGLDLHYRVGVEFIEIDEGDRQRISDFVAYSLRD